MDDSVYGALRVLSSVMKGNRLDDGWCLKVDDVCRRVVTLVQRDDSRYLMVAELC